MGYTRNQNLHQKKFFSNSEIDSIITDFAKAHDMGYSEALREIVREWQEAYNDIVKVNIDGVIKDGKIIWKNGEPISLEKELARR